MRSLFLRIFLAFWAAMLLVLLSTAAIAWYRLAQYQTVDMDQLAAEAAARLEKEGVPGLRKWIAESERKYDGRSVYIVDYTGVDILQRELSSRLQGYVHRLERAGLLTKGVPRDLEPNPLLLTPQFMDRDNTVYTVMVEAPGWPLSVLRSSDVRLLLLAFALVISGLVCWSLARYVSKPVERLQSSARSLAAGNLEARVGEEFSRRRDELGVLARDFDTMAEHVRTLLASREALLRGMSHELRSPLARLRVAAGLARRPGADVVRQLDRIELEAERLDTLIGQMLQVSQLRAVELALPREPVDLTSLLVDIVEDARLEASAANKAVEWTPGENVFVEGDHGLMRSAVENVLRNAVRFTKETSAVRVSVGRERGQAVVVIEDRGPGVPESELERIFEPFYRVAESRDRDSGGTGLGLAITGRIVRLYGGDVRASNITEGGLRVEIRLPAAEGSSAQVGYPEPATMRLAGGRGLEG
jgi:two-component system sensor histidine kinase CpxA